MTGNARQELLDQLRSQIDEAELTRLDEGFLKLTRRALGLRDEWWKPGKPIEVDGVDAARFRVAYPLAMHALNNAEVALHFIERLPLVAAGNTRVAFESALTAQWVVLTDGGDRELVNYMESERHKQAASYVATLDEPESFAAAVGDRPPAHSWSVYRACARFAPSEVAARFYDIYRGLSTATHPSLVTVAAHADFEDGGEVRGLNRHGRASTVSDMPLGLALSTLWALDSLEELRKGRLNVDQIEAIGNAAGVPATLRWSDQHPERQPTRRAGS